MKIFAIIFLLTTINVVSMAQESKKESKNNKKAEQYQFVQELIQAGEFEFIGLRATPQKGRQVDLQSHTNYMRISNGNAAADMPYFGVAHNPGYGGGDSGVRFDGTPIDYKVEENDKKRKVVIKFRMKEKMEVYDCILTISSIENATFSVTSSRRSSITYYGRVIKLTKDE